MNYNQLIEELLEISIKQQASDLHISVGHPPILRIAGILIPLIKMQTLNALDTQGIAFSLMTDDQKKRILTNKEIDFSYNFKNKARFRINAFFQKGNISIVLRLIPSKIPTIEELNLPPILHTFTQMTQGFVLITGPSSHGKSTTLASLINEINHLQPVHIITIEDPIEYIFESDKGIIDQREVYQDTFSFDNALRSTFRQDPNVIMVGEMRDAKTMSITLSAAETGHLVFSTLHTNSASQTIHRIVDSFPSIQQSQIRAQLSGSLLGIVSQRLIPRIQGGLIPACEIMIMTPAIANLIRENKIHEIPSVITTSAEFGMISLNRYLTNLVKIKEISIENALRYSLDPVELKNLIR